jgi:hypothetical protein
MHASTATSAAMAAACSPPPNTFSAKKRDIAHGFCALAFHLCWLQAAYPHLGSIYRNAVPAMGMVFTMLAAATWLLLHAASQWARTRSEAKLLQRLPNAAQLAAAQHNSNQQGASGNGLGKGLPVTQMDAAKQSQLPAV